MRRRQLGNLTAYQIHEIRRGRLDAWMASLLLHSVDVATMARGWISVKAYAGGRGTEVMALRARTDDMVEIAT